MADVVGPRGAAVGLAGKRLALGRGLRRPGAAQARGREGAEVAPVGPDGLDDHEVQAGRDGIDLHGLEEVVGRVAHDHGRGGAEAAGEVANGHAGAVDAAIVSCEEQIHVGGVANNCLIDCAGAAAGDGAREQRLRGRPSIRIGRVARSSVGKGRRSPLVGEDPDAFGGKVEDCGRHGARGHLRLACRCHAAPVTEQPKSH